MNMQEHPRVTRAVERIQDLVAHWQGYLFLGVGLIIAGAVALYYSVFTSLITVTTLGALVLLGAVLEGLQAFRMQKWSGFFLHVFVALLYGVAGFFMLTRPAESALGLTLLIGGVLLVSGAFRIIYALTHAHPLGAWLLLNGLITLALGVMVWSKWPQSGLWVIGMFVGIEMIVSGVTWATLALKARQVKV